MRPPAPSTSRVFVVLLANAALAALIAAAGACSDTDAPTPTCNNNVSDAGIIPDPMGCFQFAELCAAGSPAACCTDDAGVPFMGNDLASCYYGYGACTSWSITTVVVTEEAGDAGADAGDAGATKVVSTYHCGGLDGG
jgi:hypothetical protein